MLLKMLVLELLKPLLLSGELVLCLFALTHCLRRRRDRSSTLGFQLSGLLGCSSNCALSFKLLRLERSPCLVECSLL